jgi:hypothetical protein
VIDYISRKSAWSRLTTKRPVAPPRARLLLQGEFRK